MNTVICDKCGAIMRLKTIGLSLEWICTNCNNAIVTTNVDLLNEINKLYTLQMINGDYQNIDHIKFLAQIKNVNYIQARNLLKEQKNIEIILAKKDIVMDIISKMDKLNIEYHLK